MTGPRFALVVALGLTSSVVGCASSQPPPAARADTPTVEAPAATESAEAPRPKRAVPPGTLRREDVLEVLGRGVPALLEVIDVEAMTDRGGRFLGWRVVAIRDAGLAGGDVRPGDVISRLNGRKIETPLDFYDAFQALAFARDLSLDGQRGGAPLALRYPISDDPTLPSLPHADPAPKDAKGSPAASASSR